jgi:hypothetical protein
VRSERPLVGYGPADSWHLIEDVEGFADLLLQNGLTLTGIEWVPSLQDRPYTGCRMRDGERFGTLGTFPERAAQWIRAMRSRGIRTLVSLNWNECAVREQPDEWFVRNVLEPLLAIRSDGVVFTPVSEPWVGGNLAKPRRWTEIAASAWPGELAIGAAGPGGRTEPMWPDIPHDYVDSHPCTEEQAFAAIASGAPKLLVNTDCGALLAPDAATYADLAAAALASGIHFHAYVDRFVGDHAPYIEAIGRVVGRSP